MSGDCFQVAAQLQAERPELVLVHGTVVASSEGGTAPQGYRHWHAWCEYEQEVHTEHWPYPIHVHTCIDKANGNDVELPAAFYYKLGQVEDVTRYSRTEACILMLRTRTWGPWEEGE